jgi:hypothetical protein
MARRRWKKGRMALVKRRKTRVYGEFEDVYRDPVTKLLLARGPDHGTPERARQQGGVRVGEHVLGMAQTAWAAAPGCLELLRLQGGLALGLSPDDADDIIRRWLEGAESLRLTATRAGCQRRTTGRYDFGSLGTNPEMSDSAVRAWHALSNVAERLGWARLGPLLDLVLFEVAPAGLYRPDDGAALHEWERSCRRVQLLLEALASHLGLKGPTL